MYQSKLFTKTRKEAPKDELVKNAQLLIRAGFIHKEMAGVYSFLPLGLRVLKNIESIIREEMNKIGGQEVSLTALQSRELWEKTGRWNDEVVDIWFKTKLKNDTLLGLATTHEEPLTSLMAEYVSSYRDLPSSIYQFQTKFRNELRSKSGILRGREFLMKDLYSFSKTKEEHENFYEQVKVAYINIFERTGLGDKTYLTFASGGSFSKYSHEFQTLTEAGEDTIYLDLSKKIAVNKEVLSDDVLAENGLSKKDLVEKKATEVGNIFTLGTRFSDALGLTYKTETGENKAVFMGSYGIGLSRLMGTVAEVLSDEKGLVWPDTISPFDLHLVEIGSGKPEVSQRAKKLYAELSKKYEVLYDDRDMRPGEKFADADLIGIPWQAILSERNFTDRTVEIKKRKTGQTEIVDESVFLSGEFAKLFK